MNNDTIYQVTNKAFVFTFWTEEDALEFFNKLPASSGFSLEEHLVRGKNPYLAQDSALVTK